MEEEKYLSEQTRAILCAITQPEIIDPVTQKRLTPDQYIAWVARISNPSNQMNHMTAPKLLKYLYDNNHISPFEHVCLTMEIQTTRDISRQIIRHRSFVFQEFSQRYADPTQQSSWFALREARLQDPKNRQNSIETNDMELEHEWRSRQKFIQEITKENYDWAIRNGIAKEQARAVLPEGLTMTRLFMTGNVRLWIHYCLLRTANGTQKEHILVAEKCKKVLMENFPSISHIFEEN